MTLAPYDCYISWIYFFTWILHLVIESLRLLYINHTLIYLISHYAKMNDSIINYNDNMEKDEHTTELEAISWDLDFLHSDAARRLASDYYYLSNIASFSLCTLHF